MIAKNCDSKVPEPGPLKTVDEVMLDKAEALLGEVRVFLWRDQAFHTALICMWDVIGDANRYVDAQAPWALRKTDSNRMASVLYVLADTIRCIALVAQPFMPDASANILDQLAVSADQRKLGNDIASRRLRAGTPLPPPQPVFPRYVEEEEEA